MRRNLVGIIARLEHAMAGHDDHEGVAADRLRHRMDRAGSAQGRGYFRIGPGLAARDRARIGVDALAEGGNAGHIKRNLGEIARRPTQQGCDALDCNLDIRGSTKFARIRIELIQPPPRIDLANLGKLHANNARRPPRDAAAADPRIENSVATPRHTPLAPRKDHSTAVGTRIWNFWEVNSEARRAMEQLGGWREVG